MAQAALTKLADMQKDASLRLANITGKPAAPAAPAVEAS